MNKPIVFDDQQLAAINACCDITRRLVPITGSAGTGKTLIIREVERRLRDAGYIVGVSTPTGKAARRVKEITGIDAVTNHRLLGYGMPIETELLDETTGEKKHVRLSTGPQYTRMKPLPYDVVLCDEYAMVNNEIHRNIIDSLKPGARLCTFGDANQLKPIEQDNDLKQQPSNFQRLLDKFDGIRLERIHRHEAGSGIAENGKRILNGSIPVRRDDFELMFTEQPVRMLQGYVDKMKDQFSFGGIDNQIITCMNKSWIGTERLNVSVQALFWDRSAPALELPRHRFYGEAPKPPIRVQVGTKIVYTSNVYDMGDDQGGVFNGEVGIVDEINYDDGSLSIDFGDRIINVPPVIITTRNDGSVVEIDPRKSIDLGYVLTTHKCQGSEYQRVIYVMGKATKFMQSRRNFYTGITRARTHCIVMTDQPSLTFAVRKLD